MLGDDARLASRRTFVERDNSAVIDARVVQQRSNLRRECIVADRRCERHVGTERTQIVHDVSGAAQRK